MKGCCMEGKYSDIAKVVLEGRGGCKFIEGD